jgi:integrase
VLDGLTGAPRLMAYLLYGSGLRLLECCRLRVQDVDFNANQIVARAGKGDKDRVTMLPASVKPSLISHLGVVLAQHRRDIERGAGWVELANALGASIRTPVASGLGNGCSRRRGSTWSRPPASTVAIISTNPSSSAP